MTATVAAPQGNQFGVLLAIFLVIAFTTCVVLWVHERRWDAARRGTPPARPAARHPRRPHPVAGRLPRGGRARRGGRLTGALEMAEDETPTEEFPVAPARFRTGCRSLCSRR
jgi:uncharacterized membrane protein